MSMVAMKDLWILMQNEDDDFADIMCGILYMRLLLKRWKSIEQATIHYCDPTVRVEYLEKVKRYMEVFK